MGIGFAATFPECILEVDLTLTPGGGSSSQAAGWDPTSGLFFDP